MEEISLVEAGFYNKLRCSEGFINKKLLSAAKLHFFKTSFHALNDIKRLSKITIRKVLNEKSIIIIGDCIKDSYLQQLTEFEDFVYEKYIGKKIVLFYGNCHTGAVKKYLQTSMEFDEKYEIYPLKEIQEVKTPSYFDHPVFQVCDVFIHQSIWKKNRYGEEYASENVISKLSNNCQIIAMPNVYHLPCCLFPQYYEAKELKHNNQTYFFRDMIIDNGLRQGKTIKQIAEQYYDYRFGEKFIQEEYKKFIKTVRKREQEWDIKVADFIEANIKDKPLFYEMNHPTNYLIRLYATGILTILLRESVSMGEITDYKMDTYQMPFLTEVQKALGLQYSTLNTEIRTTGVKLRKIPMNIEEYVKEYYATVWVCGEFEELINKKSKRLYNILKIENFFLKAFSKIKTLSKKHIFDILRRGRSRSK